MKKVREILKDRLTALRPESTSASGWHGRHLAELATTFWRDRSQPTAIVDMLIALACYADAHEQRYGVKLGTDRLLGKGWLSALRGVRVLLNGELGGLDGGTVDAAILDMAKAAGFDEEV